MLLESVEQWSFSGVQPLSVWNGHRAAMLTMTSRWEAPMATTQLSWAVMSGSLFHTSFCCCELISSFVLSIHVLLLTLNSYLITLLQQ